MQHTIKALVLILLFSMTHIVNAEVYRWVDEDTGNVVYSDQPGKNAKRIKIRGSSSYSHTPVMQQQEEKPEKKPVDYTSLSILSPADDLTIRDNTGNIPVSLSINPVLKPGHTVVLTLDGNDIRLKSSRFIIKNIDRGTHTLVARIVNQDEEVLISSKPSRFHLKRQSVLFKKGK